MAESDRENNEQSKEEPSLEVTALGGLLTISGITFNQMISFLTDGRTIAAFFGILAGAFLAVVAVNRYDWASAAIGPAVRNSIYATMTAQPTNTPPPTKTPVPTSTPSLSIKVYDDDDRLILPQKDEYELDPGEEIVIKVEPTVEGKNYQWVAVPSEEILFSPRRPIGPRVEFAVPKKSEQRTVITVCEFDERIGCLDTKQDTIIIRTVLFTSE